jgi:outer membrane protein insertion porin family
VLDEDALQGDVATLRAALFAAGHRRARVDAPRVKADDDAADVELPVRAGPRMRFRFVGNAVFPSALLDRQLGLDPDAQVDAPALDAAVERLLLWYRAHGRADARVDLQERPRGRDLEVVFHVDEGVAYRLAPLQIDGVEERDPGWVRGRIAADLAAEQETPAGHSEAARALAAALPGARAAPAIPGPLAAGGWWDETTFDRAAERVVDVYRAEGWLEALYLGSTLDLDRRTGLATVTLRFHEGPRTRVESISFEGNATVPLETLTREARLAPGDPLAYDRVEETRLALLRLYLSRGYAYARVEAREDQDRDRHVAAVRYLLDEGPQVRIGRVIVTGNRRTQGVVVRGALAVKEGAIYDPEALARSQAALLRLGVFRSVNIRLRDSDVRAPVKDVAVDLAERPHASLVHGVGFSLANGPRAVLEFTRPNLWGHATELTVRGKVNYLLDLGALGPDLSGASPADRLEGRADVGLRTSRLRLFGKPAGVRVDAIGEILHRRAYDLRRASAVTGVDVAVTSSLTTSLQYELEVDDIRRTDFVGQLTQADVERLRFDEGITTLHALRPSFTLDRRDNAAHPHRGWFGTGSLEYARSLGSSGEQVLGVLPGSDIHVNMLKLQGTLTGYLPFGKASVVALSVRGGRVYPLDATSRTIIPRRFFLGGSSTMRGYGEELMIQQDVRQVLAAEARLCATSASGVGCTERGRRILAGEQPVSEGGEAFLLGKAEFRLAVSPSLETGFFLDLGNLWLDPTRFALLDLRPNAGFGLRLVTPVGPAAIDFGFNVWPDRVINERVFALHFTIGLF